MAENAKSAVAHKISLALIGFAAIGWLIMLLLVISFADGAARHNAYLAALPEQIQEGLAWSRDQVLRGEELSDLAMGALFQQADFAEETHRPLIAVKHNMARLGLAIIVLLFVGVLARTYPLGPSAPKAAGVALLSGALSFAAVSVLMALAEVPQSPLYPVASGRDALLAWLVATALLAAPLIALFWMEKRAQK